MRCADAVHYDLDDAAIGAGLGEHIAQGCLHLDGIKDLYWKDKWAGLVGEDELVAHFSTASSTLAQGLMDMRRRRGMVSLRISILRCNGSQHP